METICEYCGAVMGRVHGGEWNLTRCTTCRHLLNLFSLEAAIQNPSLFFDDPAYIEFRAANRVYFESIADDRLKDLLNRFGDVGTKTLLEVGCSTGEFIHKASRRFRAVAGQDLSLRAVEYCNSHYGLNACNDLSELSGETFDIVCCFHVVEHLVEPKPFIVGLLSHVKPGGILYLRTPNAGSWLGRLAGRNWPGVSGEHINLFTPASMKLTLDAVHLEDVSVFSRSHGRFLLGTIKRILGGGSAPNSRSGAGASRNSGNEALAVMKLADKLYFPFSILENALNAGDELVALGKKTGRS